MDNAIQFPPISMALRAIPPILHVDHGWNPITPNVSLDKTMMTTRIRKKNKRNICQNLFRSSISISIHIPSPSQCHYLTTSTSMSTSTSPYTSTSTLFPCHKPHLQKLSTSLLWTLIHPPPPSLFPKAPYNRMVGRRPKGQIGITRM